MSLCLSSPLSLSFDFQLCWLGPLSFEHSPWNLNLFFIGANGLVVHLPLSRSLPEAFFFLSCWGLDLWQIRAAKNLREISFIVVFFCLQGQGRAEYGSKRSEAPQVLVLFCVCSFQFSISHSLPKVSLCFQTAKEFAEPDLFLLMGLSIISSLTHLTSSYSISVLFIFSIFQLSNLDCVSLFLSNSLIPSEP